MAPFDSVKWDAIVVGSGLGGMTTASLLAEFGKKVLILEQHYEPGGFTHTFKRKGFEWDVGVHYVGQVQDPKSILRRVFDHMSGGQLKWAPMDQIYDRIIIAGDNYDFVSGLENQIANLTRYFPEEKRAIRRYYRLVKSVAASSAWFFGEKTMPPRLSWWVGWILRWNFEKYAKKSTYEVLSRLTQNQKLIGVLCAQCGDYGLTPKRSSFGIHAIVVDHYINGASYPVGGAKSIHQTLLERFKKLGGHLHLRCEVEEIILNEARNSVTGVRLKGGREIFASIVVSNAGFRNTFGSLLRNSPQDVVAPEVLNLEPSSAHVCLYVGLGATDNDLGLPKNNIWIYCSYDFDQEMEKFEKDPESEPGLIYISFPSAKDPEWSVEHSQKSAVQVIIPFPYEFVKRWEDKKDDDYKALKARLTKKLLAKLIEHFPQIKSHVVHCELSTPLSTRRFMQNRHGEIYGLAHTSARFRARGLRPETSIAGLYLTGQDIVTVGVGGALMSGVLTAIVVLKKLILFRVFFKNEV